MSAGFFQMTSTSDGSTTTTNTGSRRSSTGTEFTDFHLDAENTGTLQELLFVTSLAEGLAPRHWLPVDRQKLSHILWRNQRKVMPEIDRSTQGVALDLGAGCGLWVKEVSQEFPQLQVIGVDLYDDNHVPESHGNSRFLRADCENETKRWSDCNSVDLINLHDACWWLRNPCKLCICGFETLKKGGWFQNQDMHISGWHSNKPGLQDWRDRTLHAASSLKLPFWSHDNMKTALLGAGFENIHEASRTLTWSASTVEGAQVIELVQSTVRATYGLLVQGSQCSSAQVIDILNGVIQELDQHDTWVDIGTSVLWAQKPVCVT